MPKPEELKKLLAQFRIAANEVDNDFDDDLDDDFDDDDDQDSDNSTLERYADGINKLPKNLKTFAYFLLERDDKGQPVKRVYADEPEKLERQNARTRELRLQIDKLSSSDRTKLFAAFAPQLAKWLEAGWQVIKQQPYQVSYTRKAFRAPNNPAATAEARLDWIKQAIRQFKPYKAEALTLGWLAAWAQHAFDYHADLAEPLLIAAINAGGKEGDEVFDILYQTVTREHPIGIMGNHVIATLLGANRQDGWELMEKTLLAAQRQEGLRQSIVQNIDCAHPSAFVRMLRLILDKDLIRFSSVARSVNVWLGLMWDSVSAKVLTENVQAILKMVESAAERKKGIASSDPETVYRALWASAFEDAAATIPLAAKLLTSKSDEIRFVAAMILTMIGLEESERANLAALEDPNLHVAMMAAVASEGLSLNEEADEMNFSGPSEDELPKGPKVFEAFEKLYNRLPEKPQKLKAIVWPWTERKIERSMIAGRLLGTLGDLPPTRMLPYMKGLDVWEQRTIIDLLAAQKKWDTLTRSTLFDLVGHASADVRSAAFNAIEKQTLKDDEWQKIESYLSRTAADLRSGCIKLILKGSNKEALASATRLATAGDRAKRLAGLEIYRQLAEGNRSRKACQEQAAMYRSQQKKLTKEEETQLTAIEQSDREVLSLKNGLGLFDPAARSKVVPPKKKKVTLVTKTAIACIESLDALIHEHRATSVRIKTYRGYQEELLGEIRYYSLPSIDLAKPLAPQKAKFPLMEIWEKWKANRPAKLKDKDGLELLRAMYLTNMLDDYRFDDARKWLKQPANAKLTSEIVGEISIGKTKHLELVAKVISWLCLMEIPKGCVDYLLDCAENNLALIPGETLKTAIPKPQNENSRRHYYDDDDDEERDWRSHPIYTFWLDALQRFIASTEIKLTAQQKERIWHLERFHDEPCEGATRRRLDFSSLAEAFLSKLATRHDVMDALVGPQYGYRQFDDLQSLTSRPLSKENQAILERDKRLVEMIDTIRDHVYEIEIARGEASTPATCVMMAIESMVGIDRLFRTMSAVDSGKLKVESGYGRDPGSSRAATLTHMMKITYPSESDTPAAFQKKAKEAMAAGYCSEARLLELAFLAPQWTKFVEATLAWNGFSEGLYWFLAHMSGSDATEAAAEAEGLEADPHDDDVDYDDDDDMDDSSEGDSITKPQRLSAWERLILERTPLTAEQRYEGAVDVAWFHRTWKELGEKRFTQMAEAAKFAANSAQAKKAQFLADVLLGKKPRKELVEGIEKKKLKEYVRLLGLLPLAEGGKRDADIAERYKTLQSYKKYARGLSSLTKPAAMLAAEIGMQNLARLAGYADPLRMEWALEADSIKDLAAGPVSVTKEGVTVTLQLDSDAKPVVSVRKGDKPIKSIPAPVKKKHAQIAELADRAAELRRSASRMKQSLEAAMCRGDTISAAELIQLSGHAILAPQLGRLVFIGDGIAGYPDKGGKVLRDHSGKLEPIKKNELLRIAHPSDLLARGDWDKWQHDCFTAERVQPFKQVFRELYVVTKQEKKDQTASHRFAGQQISPKQAIMLWNSRGWNTQDQVVKIFHDLSLIAEVNFQYNFGTAAEIEGLTLESVEFRKRDEYKPLKLDSIPARLFSEVMRDMDLVVSVAHRGEVDPEASASTTEMRAALLRETAQLLGLKNITFKPSHAVIKGYYGEYSVHLGSAIAHRLPGGALAILPVHAQHRGRLFLPFADDDPRTAELISKVLLLARDEEIMDPSILDQIGAPVGKRRVVVQPEAPKATSAAGGKGKSQAKAGTAKSPTASAGSAPGSKRHFEFAEGSSSKFWEIELSGNTVTTWWGRIGTTAQSKSKQFADATKAKAEYDKLVAEKTGKGYQEGV